MTQKTSTDALAKAVERIGDDPEFGAILGDVQRLTGMRFAAIAHVSVERWICCQVEDDIDFGLSPGEELEVRKTICDEVRQYSCEILIDDAHQDPDWWNHPVPLLYGFRSYLALPLLVDGKFFGTLCAIDPAPRDRPLANVVPELRVSAARAALLLLTHLDNRPDLKANIPLIEP